MERKWRAVMSSKKGSLHKLLAFADKFAQEQFRDDGEVRSFWLCETGAGVRFFVDAPHHNVAEKVVVDRRLRDLFLDKDVAAYVHCAECWLHEPDFSSKREAVVLSGEARDVDTTLLRIRSILRPTNGKPTLAPPSNWDGGTQRGRFTRMFEPEPEQVEIPVVTTH
jgi:hypothetical protein